MKLDTLLSPDCTVCAAQGKSKKSILEQISAIAANKIGSANTKELLNNLINREKLGSTGIGNGIAIPHGRINNNENPVAVLLTTEKPILFDAIDDKPVDIFFALFVPEDHCQQHLETLASVAKFFSNKENSRKVRRCNSSKELHQLIVNN